MGTVAYMSPEQARGKELDPRTDIFSFGTVLYEMASGVQSFRGDSTADIFDGLLNRPPEAPVKLNPALPSQLENIINKALQKEPDQRYQNASELREDLQRLRRDVEIGSLDVTLTGTIPATASKVAATSVVTTPAASKGKSHRSIWLGSTGLLIFCLALVGWLFWDITLRTL